MALLTGDQWIKRKFTPTCFLTYQILEKYFQSIDIISVARRNQASNTSLWHYHAKKI